MPIGGNQFLNPTELIDLVGLTEGQEVADLGCGAGGYFSLPFARRVGPTGMVYAVDIQKHVLESIQKVAKSENLINLKTIWGDLEKPQTVAIPKNQLDIAFLINVLFQNKNKEQIILGAWEMIKPYGKLVVVDWKPGSFGFGPPDSLKVSQDQIIKIVEKFGGQLLIQQEIGNYHYVLIFKKP